MSGHSHFKSIKHRKEITDKKRGQIFSKMARLISIAVKEKGPNPDTNPKLQLAIGEARSFNLPKDNIERAIKKGTGESTGKKLEEIALEAYGLGEIAIIIEGITDNTNRTISEIKQILIKNNGKLANEGSVRWLFERKGVIIISKQETINKEELELKVIEAGAEDIYWHDDLLDVYTKPKELERVKKIIEDHGIKIETISLDWVAKNLVTLNEKEKTACQGLFELLDENDAVQEIYSNLKE